MRVILSGMPELRLGLNDKVLFQSVGRKLPYNVVMRVRKTLLTLSI